MVARPATYQHLLREIRSHFPNLAAVYNLVVLFKPTTNDGLLENWVQVAPSAYGHVHDSAELFVNVAHPLTKDYILPLPDRPIPYRQLRKEVRGTDGHGNHVEIDTGDQTFPAEDVQVSKTKPRVVSSRHRGATQAFDNSSMSLELERPGGDAFTSGWGGASERFRRSTKLVPDLRDCKKAVGQTVGQSNFYHGDEEEEIADIKLGEYQEQYQEQYQGQYQGQPTTEVGWYPSSEPTQMEFDRDQIEAQHLAGGLTEDLLWGEQAPQVYSDDANREWLAAAKFPQNYPGAFAGSDRGPAMPLSPEWGHQNTGGWRWGGYRTPSPGQWLPHQEHNFPEYARSRSCSPAKTRAWNQEANPGVWNDDIADQGFSRIVAGPGHLTNGAQTNGVTTNGNLTNGEVRQFPHGQDQHYRASEWSPPPRQSDAQHRREDLQLRNYLYGEPASKAIAGPRPRRDPAEVTYGSPRPRIQGSNSGWTTIGRRKNNWTDIPLQEESDPVRVEPRDNGNSHAWYAQTPPQNFFHGAASHGRGPSHWYSGAVRDKTNGLQQKQRPGREMSWGSDFWGGPPPNRTQRGGFTHDDTPASKHWR